MRGSCRLRAAGRALLGGAVAGSVLLSERVGCATDALSPANANATAAGYLQALTSAATPVEWIWWQSERGVYHAMMPQSCFGAHFVRRHLSAERERRRAPHGPPSLLPTLETPTCREATSRGDAPYAKRLPHFLTEPSADGGESMGARGTRNLFTDFPADRSGESAREIDACDPSRARQRSERSASRTSLYSRNTSCGGAELGDVPAFGDVEKSASVGSRRAAPAASESADASGKQPEENRGFDQGEAREGGLLDPLGLRRNVEEKKRPALVPIEEASRAGEGSDGVSDRARRASAQRQGGCDPRSAPPVEDAAAVEAAASATISSAGSSQPKSGSMKGRRGVAVPAGVTTNAKIVEIAKTALQNQVQAQLAAQEAAIAKCRINREELGSVEDVSSSIPTRTRRW